MFGILEVIPSLGGALVDAIVADSLRSKHHFAPNADVISNPIPLLILRISLVETAEAIDFGQQALSIDDMILNACATSGGHMAIRMFSARTPLLRQCDIRAVYHMNNSTMVDIAVEGGLANPELTAVAILHVRKRIDSATPIAFERIFRMGKRSPRAQVIHVFIRLCGSGRSNGKVRRPLTSRLAVSYAGELASMDRLYPGNRNRDRLSRPSRTR